MIQVIILCVLDLTLVVLVVSIVRSHMKVNRQMQRVKKFQEQVESETTVMSKPVRDPGMDIVVCHKTKVLGYRKDFIAKQIFRSRTDEEETKLLTSYWPTGIEKVWKSHVKDTVYFAPGHEPEWDIHRHANIWQDTEERFFKIIPEVPSVPAHEVEIKVKKK